MSLSSTCICRRSFRSSAPSDHRAGERDTLLLAAGELPRATLGDVIELDHLQGLMGAHERVLGATAPQAEGDVLEHRHVREQRVALEDRVDRTPERRHARHVVVADEHAPRRRFLEPRNDAQGRRLAAARRTEQSEERTRRDGQVQFFDRREAGEPLADVVESEVGSGRRRLHVRVRLPRERTGTRC
jgi:hypothetical protein